jgi:hypothetical protein
MLWELTDDDKTFVCAHNHKHSPCFLSEQEIFQLSVAEFLAFLLQENAESFITLNILLSHMMFCRLQWTDLQEFSWHSIIYLTSVPVSGANICPSLWGNILMTVYKHILIRISLFSQQRLWNLVSYYALCSLTDCSTCFKGSWFARFERTSCFQNFGNWLPGCTELHPRNSKPNLQIYIAEQQYIIHYAFV